MPSNTQQTPFIPQTFNTSQQNNFQSYTIKPVFDVSNFGRIDRLYLSDPTAVLVSVVNSTTTRANFASSTTSPPTTGQPIKDQDIVISNSDTMPLAGYASNTDMAQSFVWLPLADSYLTAIKFNIGFGLNVSVAGAGTVTFSKVSITATYLDQPTGAFFEPVIALTGLTGIAAATGSQLFYFNQDFNVNPDLRINAGRPVLFTITTTSADTGAATRQMGIYPHFSPQKQLSPAVPIQYVESFIDIHTYPALDQGQQSLTDALTSPAAGRLLDCSGFNPNAQY